MHEKEAQYDPAPCRSLRPNPSVSIAGTTSAVTGEAYQRKDGRCRQRCLICESLRKILSSLEEMESVPLDRKQWEQQEVLEAERR